MNKKKTKILPADVLDIGLPGVQQVVK